MLSSHLSDHKIVKAEAPSKFTPPSATKMECTTLTRGKSLHYIISDFVV